MAVFEELVRCSCGERRHNHIPLPDPSRRTHLVPRSRQPEVAVPDPGGRSVGIRQLEALPGELPTGATARQEEIYALRMAGYGQTQIARLTGWSQSLVSTELARLVVVRPMTRVVDTDRIVRLHGRGLLQSQIARRAGVSQQTVSRHLRRASG